MTSRHSLGDLTPEEFVLRGIERLRTPPYKCIHSVFSGLNAAFREYFPLLDPVEVQTKLAEEGKIVIRPARRGVLLYKAADAPLGTDTRATLDKILGDFGDLTPEEFVLRGIERLRTPPYRCVHSVFSGLNAAFREYFPLLDPVEVQTKLAEQGKIVIRPASKGVLLYKAGDAQPLTDSGAALGKIVED